MELLSSRGVQHFAFFLHLTSRLAVSHTHEDEKESQSGGESQYKALALYHNLPAPLNLEPGFHFQSFLSSAKALLHLCLLLLDQSTRSPKINRCGPWTIGTEILVHEMCMCPEVADFWDLHYSALLCLQQWPYPWWLENACRFTSYTQSVPYFVQLVFRWGNEVAEPSKHDQKPRLKRLSPVLLFGPQFNKHWILSVQ